MNVGVIHNRNYYSVSEASRILNGTKFLISEIASERSLQSQNNGLAFCGTKILISEIAVRDILNEIILSFKLCQYVLELQSESQKTTHFLEHRYLQRYDNVGLSNIGWARKNEYTI